MIETKIICDTCNKPIVGRNGYPINDYIVVSKKDIPMAHTGGIYLISQKPALDREYHFCNIFCVVEWEKLKIAKNKLDEINNLKIEKIDN